MKPFDRCPQENCGGILLAEPEEMPVNYRGSSTRRLKGWVLRCLSCGREAGEATVVLPKVAAGRLR